MKKAILMGVAAAMVMAGPALAGEAPKSWNKCKACHGAPGGGDKVGPDLANSKLDEGQFVQQCLNGSEWAGRPAKLANFESKKMPKIKVTEDEAKELFAWIHGK